MHPTAPLRIGLPLAAVLSLVPFPSACPASAQGPAGVQGARIYEEIRSLQTYPFSEPDPVPILVRDRRLYPYHSFEGYSVTSEPQDWKVVTLENDYIQVFVLPEVGGKVWGAVVKETGHEFIYRNEVMKFRNIALRGPWTSGGIEFNFGVIGHTPSTATPVDYLLRENPDGSVSCVVGAMDLPSRTQWRVEVRLPADRATFETRVLWFNPTPLAQPYYNWMTAAAFARNDLEMSMPGNAYLQHSGRAEPWPVDEAGRYLPLYANNDFDGHKSYHVVGELHDFFGGYYRDADYGFGHWARYEDMPGQKLWLWALSREGGVWENLLTDTDGQYVEFQAGRLFVQYSPGADVNPITQAAFPPYSASRWSETWFPLEGIGGLTDASADGAMHVSREGDRLSIRVNAFRHTFDTLRVWSGDQVVALEPLELQPLEPFLASVFLPPEAPYQVSLPGLGLEHVPDRTDRFLSRPFDTDPQAWEKVPEIDRRTFQARELVKARQHLEAREIFEAVIREEPWNRQGLLGLAELSYRSGSFDEGLRMVNRALQLDAYDAEANFLAGILYRAVQRNADARDAFGWAARFPGFRSAAYAQLAELMIREGDWGEASRYAHLAVDFDRHSLPGWRALAVVGRRSGDLWMAETARQELLDTDPLHHFVRAEEYLSSPQAPELFLGSLGGEYPDQALLELAIYYAGLGSQDDAAALLEVWTAGATGEGTGAPGGSAGLAGRAGEMGSGLLPRAWLAWLRQDPSLLPGPEDPGFTFPYRTESIPVLEWAARSSEEWVWKYLLALNLWAVNRDQEAASILEALGPTPEFGPLYVARAQLLSEVRGASPLEDLRRAVALDPGNRILQVRLIRHLQETGAWIEAMEALEAAGSRFPEDFNLALLRARALIHLDRALEATRVLAATTVLPSENARESHRLYEQAHTLAALDALEAGETRQARRHLQAALEWPESLGQGRPYHPEERLVRFLLARLDERQGSQEAATREHRAVLESTPSVRTRPTPRAPASLEDRLDLLALPSLHALGEAGTLEAIARYTQDESDVGVFASRLAGPLAWGSEPPWDTAARLAPEFPFLFDDLDGQMLLRALTIPATPAPRAGTGGGDLP